MEERDGDAVDRGFDNLVDRLQGKVLEDISTCFVKPSTATPIEKEWQPLCKLDYLWMPFYTPILCTFTLTDHRFGSAAGVVQHLKDSLAETLVLFYPLAGRLLMKDGPPRIHCNDAGAVFTEASVDVDMAELRSDDFLPVPSLSGLAAAGFDKYPTLPEVPDGLPVLIIQATHFKCGGIALAVNWAHAVADGLSGMHFMKSWSEIARGAQVSLLPVHHRDLVKPRDPPIPCDFTKPLVVSPEAQIIASKKKAENDQLSTPLPSNSPEAKPDDKPNAFTVPITTKVAAISEDEITQLRKIAMEHNPNPSIRLTRADCLSTHLMRTIARARNLPNDSRARLWILVEGRQKFSLPPGYFGNVVGMTQIVTTVNELLNGPMGNTAALIHSSVASITGEWFQGFVDWVGSSTGKSLFTPENIGPNAECGVSYQTRFPFYDLDFGFGAPGFSIRNSMGAWDGLVFILPSSPGTDHTVVMPNLKPGDLCNFMAMVHDIPT